MENIFPKLILPEQPVVARESATGSGADLYDCLRRKWVAATPEEWVRQNFVQWMVRAKGYPASLMANEVGIRLNGTLKRIDTIVYRRDLKPLMLIEYKSPDVAVTQRVFNQISRYNIVEGADYLVVFNGLSLYCMRRTAGSYIFLKELPDYQNV